LADFYWPDSDNSLRALAYTRGGLIIPNPDLVAADQIQKALATINLTGLDKYPSNQGRMPTSSDRRWERRREIWDLAEKGKARLAANDCVELREQVVETALGRGMFSIWWTVFAGDSDMRRRLREGFVGTHGGSFDNDENLVARAGGQL
jgi:hypothetical protein